MGVAYEVNFSGMPCVRRQLEPLLSTGAGLMRVLLTGATGFVGRALLERLHGMQGITPIAGTRRTDALALTDIACERLLLGDLTLATPAVDDLRDIDVVVHVAARVHVMDDAADDPLEAFRAVNVRPSLRLAQAAAQAGVRRFLYISSIKVNGEASLDGLPFTAEDMPRPQDPYGISKWEAEQVLADCCQRAGMELVVVRPPLVYGPGVRANFLRLMQGLSRGLPLPLGAMNNRRSLVALENLIDLLVVCLDHPRAANQTFLVSDDEDISIADLARKLSRLLGSRAWLIPLPPRYLRAGLQLLGRRSAVHRLCGELRVDIVKTRTLLNWAPPQRLDQALAITAKDYLERLVR